MDSETLKRIETRRGTRVPYLARAVVQIPGVTPKGNGWAVETRDANEWGLRISAPYAIPLLPVTVTVRAPNGIEVKAAGSVVHATEISAGSWEAGIRFNAPQPCLSATCINRATFGG